ncbi:MAG: hypothetical protein ACP5L0_06265, partial [Caldisphaera sp.]
FYNAPCGRGVTEGSLSTGFISPSPEGTTQLLQPRSKNNSLLSYKKVSIRGLSIPSLTEGDFRPLNPRKVKNIFKKAFIFYFKYNLKNSIIKNKYRC